MIVGYVGLPGSGKTYLMSKHAIQEMRRKRSVYANYPLKNARYYEDFKQVLNVRKGVIVADEMQMLAPARFYRSLPPQYFALWSQSRHMGIDFWYTSQAFHRVDVAIRNVTNYVWVCKRVFGRYHVAKLYDASDIERERVRAKWIKKESFFLSKSIFRVYDTMYIVKSGAHLTDFDKKGDVDPDSLPVWDADLNAIGIPSLTYGPLDEDLPREVDDCE